MEPQPVSQDRLIALLSTQDVQFGQYAEAELVLPTPNAIYFLDTSNEKVLQMRAQWRGIAEDDAEFQALIEQVAQCNATRTGPKAYLAPLEGAHRYGLMAECDIVATQGLSQEQLMNFIETSMGMIMSFLMDVEAAIPDLVTWGGGAGTETVEG